MSAAGDLSVVRLQDGREEEVGRMLARSFAADPIFTFVEPDESPRLAFLEEFMAALARRSHRLSTAYVTQPALRGVSLWKSPELRRLSPEQLRMTGLDRVCEWLSPPAMARFDAIFEAIDEALERASPEPVWYLGVLGVDPEWQGRGLGSRLMQPILERADAEGVAVTLETGQPRNLPLYARHGFEVTREVPPVESGAPAVWTMKRGVR